MQQWNYFETSPECFIAYQLQQGKILINNQVGYYKDGLGVMNESATEVITLNPDGTFILASNELNQFNCCHTLWSIVELINHLTEKLVLSKATILTQSPVFKIHNIEYNGIYKDWADPVDLKFSFILDGKLYNDNRKNWTNYTFLDRSILQKSWTVATLANFTLHMMKFLYQAEKSGPNQTSNFLDVDYDIENM